jgi:hypothetical protein
MQSDDPDFELKAAGVIDLYVNRPDHAAVFAADEKTAIQALDRLDPVLPLSPGRAERHGFEYQVGLWFSTIGRDLLARGICASVADLARKTRRYIHRYHKAPKPIRWAYRNPARRISSTSASTVH